jgi:hypothetical protein
VKNGKAQHVRKTEMGNTTSDTIRVWTAEVITDSPKNMATAMRKVAEE